RIACSSCCSVLDGIELQGSAAIHWEGVMGWGWKNIVGLICVAIAIWLISYMVEWSIRTGGQVHMGDALMRWWSNVVMLRWVERYQTLLAGILAVAAGSFVLFSTLVQRAQQHESDLRQQHQSLLSDIAAIR